ncbi:MAG: hypothetical protein ACI91R_001609 [Vicingaceae bacterium]|jgi:hypothetical protein
MELKTKKIVAREGLIIISILFLSALLMFVSDVYRDKKREIGNSEKLFSFSTEERDGKVHEYENEIVFPANEENLEQRVNEILDASTIETREEWVRINYGEEIEAITKRNKYGKYSEYTKKVAFIIFFLLYPSYLMLRFIVWSIAILRK